MNDQKIVESLNTGLKGASIPGKLKYLVQKFPGKVIFTTSFGYEDQVISDMIFQNEIPVEVITLDTGRMFEETYKVYRSTVEKYGRPIKAYFPPSDKVEKLLNDKGPFSFY